MNETLTLDLIFVNKLETGIPVEFDSIASKMLIEKM
jgi:hypothetical protein